MGLSQFGAGASSAVVHGSLTLSKPSSSPFSLADVQSSVISAFAAAAPRTEPYRHWRLLDVLPAGMTAALRDLPFPRPDLGGISGKRELHNDQRCYFDAANNDRFAICAAIAGAFQSSAVVGAIESATGADFSGSSVRLEFAQDTDGFWLEPHTDLGVKLFTMLLYLPESPEQADLGTDIYRDPQTWAARHPFTDNSALSFIPGQNTWHGLARRPIPGVRKSVIMNYVTNAWRAREQLAYPTTPVRS